LHLFGALIQALGYLLPAVEVLHLAGAGHHDEFAADDLVDLDGVGEALRLEGLRAVVRGEAADAEIVQELSNVFSIARRPLEVGCIELHALVTHLGYGPDRAHEVLLELVADGVELEAERDAPGGRQSGGEWGCGGDG